MIDHLQSSLPLGRDTALGFIYCNYKERAHQNFNSLVSNLVTQLMPLDESIPDQLRSLHQRHTKQGTRPSRSELLALLQSTTENMNSLYIVIDALDECDDTDGTRSSLISDVPALLPAARFLFTSRPLKDIERHFEGYPCLEIRASDDDIRRFIVSRTARETRLAKHLAADQTLLPLISETIVNKSDGMSVLSLRLRFFNIFEFEG